MLSAAGTVAANAATASGAFAVGDGEFSAIVSLMANAELYYALREAGVGEKAAMRVAEAIPPKETLATKGDLIALRAAMDEQRRRDEADARVRARRAAMNDRNKADALRRDADGDGDYNYIIVAAVVVLLIMLA